MARNLFHGGIASAILALFLSILSSSALPSFALVHPSQIISRHRHKYSPPPPRKCAFFSENSCISSSSSRSVHILHNSANNDVDDDTPSSPNPQQQQQQQTTPKKHKHTLAILTMPHSTSARIANEAILETAISITTNRLSVVLRTNTGGSNSITGEGHSNVSLTQLRRYAGEIYSMAWDAALGLDERENNTSDKNMSGDDTLAGPIASGGKLMDLIVYPQNMPNTPPEGWIDLRPDLTCICSHDSIVGWISSDLFAGGSGREYASKKGQGNGGLREHVNAVNADREFRGLNQLDALHVDNWPDGAEVTGDPNVVFLEDEDAYETIRTSADKTNENDDRGLSGGGLVGGAAIPPSSLYSSVCVGGTFDGMHYGHRKLLTLALSSVRPIDGRLLVGVTRDEMLTHKAFAESIPTLEERVAGVLDFVGNLAPGMKNRIRCVPISDEYGPPGQPEGSEVYPGVKNDFDALVLSHETLPTGRKLNNYREETLGLGPLKLLCTQRTEPHGMSSTALRRMRTSKK